MDLKLCVGVRSDHHLLGVLVSEEHIPSRFCPLLIFLILDGFADPDFSNSKKWLLGNIKLFYLTFDHLLIAFATCFFAGVGSCARQNNLSDESLRVWPFYLGIQIPAIITSLEWHSLCLMLTQQSCLFPVNTCLSEKPNVQCWAGACALPKLPVCESSLGRLGWEPPEHDASMDITVMASGIIGTKGEFFIKSSWNRLIIKHPFLCHWWSSQRQNHATKNECRHSQVHFRNQKSVLKHRTCTNNAQKCCICSFRLDFLTWIFLHPGGRGPNFKK